MRIARSVLENVAGLEIFAIIGILLFFAFFVGLIIYVVRMKKSHVDAYSRLPLGEDNEDNLNANANEKISRKDAKKV